MRGMMRKDSARSEVCNGKGCHERCPQVEWVRGEGRRKVYEGASIEISRGLLRAPPYVKLSPLPSPLALFHQRFPDIYLHRKRTLVLPLDNVTLNLLYSSNPSQRTLL